MKKFNFMPFIMAMLLTIMSNFILTSCSKDKDNDPISSGQSGDGNSGDQNPGNSNSGDGNSGDGNSGNGNSGDGNSGDGNSGNGNSGDGNSGDGNSGNGNPPTPEPIATKLEIGKETSLSEILENKFTKGIYNVKICKFENNTKETEDKYTKRLTPDDCEYPIFAINTGDTLKICTTADKIIMSENCGKIFNGFKNIEKIINTQILDMSNVTSFENMFSSCTSLQEIEGIETWNVEKVENFSSMFYACTKLIEINIENWKVTNKAKDLSFMFSQCGVEKLNLEKWNTESVETMENMFYISKIKTFIGKGWNTLKCNNFNNIFEKTTIEELDLSNWEINEKVDKSTLSLISGSQSIHITCSKEIQSIIKVYLAGATWTLVD